MYIETTALHKLLKLTKRIKGVQGGTSASKTISIEQILIDKSQSDVEPVLTSIMSESMPHLKRGAMRDFKNIMIEHKYWDDFCWNSTDATYTFPLRDPISGKLVSKHGSKIEFFSLDMPHKVRGPRRGRGFINEANNIPLETFEQIEVRTEDELWLDWNPTTSFWWHEHVMTNPEMDIDFITLTYKDNEGLPESIVKSIESRKANKNWWKVYGLGQLGEVEGKIYTDWNIVDEVPHTARLEGYGLDFGYSNDPSAIVAIYYHDGGYIVDEITYQKGLSNKQLADILNNQKKALVVADSAEPKSIDELSSYGVMVMAANKGQGSVLQGIQYVQDQRMSITKRSTNVIKEYRNYMWKTDKEGKVINEPDHTWSHSMDAIRYRMEALKPQAPIHAFKPQAMLSRKYSR